MVAFELPAHDTLDLAAFQALVEAELPPYAQPVFIRVLHSAQTTATFKLLKGELREQAYHPDRVGADVIYVRKPRARRYEALSREFYARIMQGQSGY